VRLPNIALGIFMPLMAIFMLAPVALVIVGSFSASEYIHFPPAALSIKHYVAALADERFVLAWQVSVVTAFATAFIAVLIALPAAVGLTRTNFPGRESVQAFLMSPLMIPHLVIGITMLHFYAALRMPATTAIIIAGHVVITFPFALRLLMASLAGLDRKLELAAVSMGASPIKAFREITLPNMRAGMMGAFAFAAIISFDDIGLSLFIAPPSRPTLPVAIFTYLDQNYDPMILAVSSFMILVSAVTILILDRLVGLSRIFMNTQAT